ncbi:GNAT family N-acetyltransferase [Spongiactinospora sp. TRM90649]|uniref:GNAT family N-acetyltransferase n=1 Tax=Spongiactinospora sp. TRM90649 TaxID=3031114 RepID=UPI0023F66D12|nr:GNAT family N-acetyltransferase [Spongiactinospora sp. TRM90649]MDF5756689.1 GNAT family N-acetyltransferase [Spongiactinospora sp. TRM90649]
MRIRLGGLGDVPAVLGMFDGAVEWLAARGRERQWGAVPFSAQAGRIETVSGWAAGGGMRIAELDGRPAGCMVLGGPVRYVEPAEEPELYVQGLVTDRRFAGRGVGGALLSRAAEEAAAGGAGLLRVDCYAGGDGRLVRYYEEQGFTRAEPFSVGGWPGQVLQRRVVPAGCASGRPV